MEDRETARMRKYVESKTTRIMIATVPHVTSDLGLRKFQADGFLLTRVYPMDRDWMGPRGMQDVLKKRKMDCLCHISNSGSSKPEPRGYNKALFVTFIMTMRTIEVKPLAWDCMRACMKTT